MPDISNTIQWYQVGPGSYLHEVHILVREKSAYHKKNTGKKGVAVTGMKELSNGFRKRLTEEDLFGAG